MVISPLLCSARRRTRSSVTEERQQNGGLFSRYNIQPQLTSGHFDLISAWQRLSDEEVNVVTR